MPEPSVWVSILNWNRYDLTIQCLEALRQLEYQNVHILVVDNASRNDSVNRIRSACPDVTLIESDANRGFADGHRLALDYVLQQQAAELFWMLNNDAVVYPDTLAHLVASYLQFGQGIFGSVRFLSDRQVGPVPSYQLDANQQSDSSKPLDQRALQDYDAAFPDKSPVPVSDVPGGSFLVPLSVIRQHGFMDSVFFLYSEEVDYCYRLGKKGIRSYLVPRSIVLHPAHTSLNTNEQLQLVRVYYQTRNPLFLTRRHSGLVALWKTIRRKHLRVCKHVLRALAKRQVYRLLRRTEAVPIKPSSYYIFLGVRDAVLNRMGKTLAPEDFWE